MHLDLAGWRTAPVRKGWVVGPLDFGRLPSGTLDSVILRGTAPSSEEGKAYLFDVRFAAPPPPDVAEVMSAEAWTPITGGGAIIQRGSFEIGHFLGLDQGRSLKLDGAKREFRVLAQEVNVGDHRDSMGISMAAQDRRNYVGTAFIAGVGTTTLH